MRFIGMDIHRDFCEVAICEDGKARSAGPIAASVEQLELLGQSLRPDDVVVLEATSGAGLIVDVLERHVARVLVANTRKLPQISRGEGQDRPARRKDARAAGRLRLPGDSVGAG